jgi:drug/metabolite transporter (DMT)-like permease
MYARCWRCSLGMIRSLSSTRMHSGAGVALLLAVTCWGLLPVATRYLLAYLDPLHLLLFRFLLASLLFLPVLIRVKRQGWPLLDMLRTGGCGCASIIGYNVTVTYGIRWLPAGIAGMIIATEPIWIALFSIIVLRERPRCSVLLGLLIATSGVLALVGWSTEATTFSGRVWIGAGLTLLAAMMWAGYTLAVRPLSRKYGALTCTGVATILGALPLLAWGNTQLLSSRMELPLPAWGAFLLLAVGSTMFANILWSYGVARLPGTQAGLFLYLIPFVSVLGGSIFLHEVVTAGTVVSGLLVLSGVVIAQLNISSSS